MVTRRGASGRSNRAALFAVVVILALAAVGIALVVGLNRNHRATSGHRAGVTSDARSATSPPASAIPVADARSVVVHYLNAVNVKDRVAAKALVCTALVGQWQSTIDKPGGDFTVSVTKATFTGATPSGDGLRLAYSLDVTSLSSGTTATNTVTFTVVKDPDGLRICGEG